MKKKTILLGFTALFLIVTTTLNATEKPAQSKGSELPENVKAVVEKSCFGCHNTASKNEDAKKELDFKKLEGLSKIQKIGAYKHIGEVLEKGEMPPKKFLERFPEKNISDVEKKLLMDWAKNEAESLVKN